MKLRNCSRRSVPFLCLWLLLAIGASLLAAGPEKSSKTIAEVLRQPLPPEELSLAETDAEFTIRGPTFVYRIRKSTGTIDAITVARQGEPVVRTVAPADIQIDRYALASQRNSVKLIVVEQGKDRVVLEAKGVLHDPQQSGPEVDFSVLHTFFNDGVVVSDVELTPRADLPIQEALAHRISAQGQFDNYLHKKRDEWGDGAARGLLPKEGQAVRLAGLTSCLQVYSPAAGLAIFTDCGGTHIGRQKPDAATIEVAGRDEGRVQVSLAQYLVHVAKGDEPYVLKAGELFRFRVGICVTPNKLPHPRMQDLRMYIWIGDEKFPYPTDEEIAEAARFGFTLFQIHRGGPPDEPRPPAGEIDRVIKKVHESGMLYLWTEVADLLYAHAAGSRKMQAAGKWVLWQGFNYGGRYTASMDPYCDMLAVCLGTPNGLADYRISTISRMMDQLPVDGIYLDDNLPYSTCTLWKEHGHPRQVYDCLIELHEMNWRRREVMRSRCPHAVLVSHCSRGFILPTICDFDAHLYGEGYSFGSMESYWNEYIAPVRSIPSQGMVCPGDSEDVRCPVSLAFNYDLLTGGGQYNQFDWRIYPKKFPYAKGTSEIELVYTKTYTLAQYYFGLYESKSYYFADSADLFGTTTPLTYAAVYQNQTWGDCLIPIANMSKQPQNTSLAIRAPQTLGITLDGKYMLFDVLQRSAKILTGDRLAEGFGEIPIAGENLRLFCVRPASADAPFHVWGGKRITEVWDGAARKLTFTVQGPAGLRDTLFIGGAKHGIRQVVVGGEPAAFAYDPAQGLAHGPVTFGPGPLKIEVLCSTDGANSLPEQPVVPDPLASRVMPSNK